jgi:chloramphenicol 3-O-phosphotransferase
MTMQPPIKLVILTGASASGKTTITKRIATNAAPIINCLYFDSIGVPSAEQMIAEFGLEENWQRAKTFDWMIRIKEEFLSKGKLVLFDGQMRISFIFEACAAAKITHYKTVLVDCDDASRESRLAINRRRPELANARMMNWARFLRNEADASSILKLDTTTSSIEECVSELLAVFDL